tara:strand:+ start:72 stop:197 length:126 start_codon:yes stop_codon:yes gene_type:complete
MIKDKVDALDAVLDMITELKLAIMKRRVKMLSIVEMLNKKQ